MAGKDPPAPEIRAAWTARVVASLDALGAETRDRIVAAIPEPVREAIDERTGLARIPVEYHVTVLQAIVAELGPKAAQEFLRAAAKQNLQGSMVRGALMAGLRVFGVGPLALLRMFPRGFGMIMTGCGTVTLQPASDGSGTEAVFRDLAPPLRTTAFVMSMGALFEALFEVARRPGTVRPDPSQIDSGVLRYLLRASDREGLVTGVEEL